MLLLWVNIEVADGQKPNVSSFGFLVFFAGSLQDRQIDRGREGCMDRQTDIDEWMDR